MARKEWAVLKVPYGGGYGSLNLAKLSGTRYAPNALQKEFKRQSCFMADNSCSSWDDALWRNINLGFRYQNSVVGWENMMDKVFSACFENLYQKDGRNILILGGSHTITASAYLGVSRVCGQGNTGLIILDAHPDCCRKASWPVHSDWLRWLVEGCHILPEQILIVGIRQIEKSEQEFLNQHNIRHYRMNSVSENFIRDNFPMVRILRKFREFAATYVSVDIDAASGVYAPGTGCPSPGGFTDTGLINFVKCLKDSLPNLRAADIVEINPLKRWQKLVLRYDPTVDLGVKLIKEIIS